MPKPMLRTQVDENTPWSHICMGGILLGGLFAITGVFMVVSSYGSSAIHQTIQQQHDQQTFTLEAWIWLLGSLFVVTLSGWVATALELRQTQKALARIEERRY